MLLCEKHKKKVKAEPAAIGNSPPHTELDDLLEEIIQKEELSEETRKDEGKKKLYNKLYFLLIFLFLFLFLFVLLFSADVCKSVWVSRESSSKIL